MRTDKESKKIIIAVITMIIAMIVLYIIGN